MTPKAPPGTPPGTRIVVEISVADLGRSLDLYLELGFEVTRTGERFAELSWHGSLFFLSVDGAPRFPSPPPANLRLLVADVDAAWQRAQQLGLPVLAPIADRSYGLRDFTVLDPDGFALRFASPLSEQR